jgi:molybdopterin-biosynthesis enzyme MoeA-like protein
MIGRRLFGKYASENGNLQNSHVFISLAVVSLVAILTVAITSSIPYYDLALNDYFQPLKSVEASTQNNTNTNAVDIGAQNSASRSYSNPVFGIKLEYPITWSAFELNSKFRDNVTSGIALLRAPLDNVSDKYAERINFNTQVFDSKNATLDAYTSSILNSYANTSGVKMLESAATTLAGQPAHKVVFLDERVDPLKLKKMQVWSVFNNSKSYVVTFGAEESKYQAYLPLFQEILKSIQVTSSIDNPQEKTELPFDDPISGIKLEYPSSWAKAQLGQPPRANVDFIAAFFHQQNRNDSISRIGVASQQLASQNVNLQQYTANQLKAIERANATDIKDQVTKIGGNPAHSADFNLNGTKVKQIWTLKDGKAYIFAYQADPSNFSKELPNFEKIANTLKFEDSKTN